ncbi:MAG: hypothetical protein WKF30_12915 [Pyrinomonadaceae bacterium]
MSTNKVFKRVRLGDDVSTYCGKCKEERTHQVVAMKSDGDIERVVCRTCQGTHLYREKKSAATAKRVGGGGRKQELLGTIPAIRSVRPYSSEDIYRIDEWISHAKFGQGRVIEARTGKVTVRFGQDTRTLMHAG